MKKILFICIHNSARSQIAEGVLNSLYGDCYTAYSAGIEPSDVNPYAISVMAEIGIDISKHRSKSIKEFYDEEFDYVISVCDDAEKACPSFPHGKKYLHKGFKDPSKIKGDRYKILKEFRATRDDIKEWIEKMFRD